MSQQIVCKLYLLQQVTDSITSKIEKKLIVHGLALKINFIGRYVPILNRDLEEWLVAFLRGEPISRFSL